MINIDSILFYFIFFSQLSHGSRETQVEGYGRNGYDGWGAWFEWEWMRQEDRMKNIVIDSWLEEVRVEVLKDGQD